MVSRVQGIQTGIREFLEKKVSNACSFELEFREEYLQLAETHLKHIEDQLEESGGQDEENGFSVINWVESRLTKTVDESSELSSTKMKWEEKVKLVKEKHDTEYESFTSEIDDHNDAIDEEKKKR